VSAHVELRGENIVLRPFRRGEIHIAWEARERLDDMPHASGWAARRRFRQRLARSGRFAFGRLDLAIDVDGRLAGEIGARRPQRVLPPGVFEVGIALYHPIDRGRGLGTEAVELLTGYLFTGLGAERVQAATAVGNRAMRRVLHKLGFTEEGVMRGFMPVGTRRLDYVLYAVMRDDWIKVAR
jgi:RimJ/RimL family protein N-acetyltransferase